MNAEQARAQTRLHSNLKKLMKTYEKQITEYNKAPLADAAEPAADKPKKKKGSDDEGEGEDGEGEDGEEGEDEDGQDEDGEGEDSDQWGKPFTFAHLLACHSSGCLC